MAKIAQQAKPIYVIYGKNEFLVEQEYLKLIDELIEPEQREMGLWLADIKNVRPVEVFDELRTFSLLAGKKVVVLKSADSFISDNRQALERYFDNPSDAGLLVMTAASWPGNTKLARKLPKVGRLIEAAEIKPWHLAGFVGRYARDKYDKTISKPTAELLVELAGDDPGRLCSEVDKLATYTNEHKTITAKDVEAVIGHNRMFDAFKVIDSMTAGDIAQAVSKLRIMFDADKSAAYSVVGAFAYHFRRMFSAKALINNGLSQQDTARRLNIRARKDVFFAQLKKTGLEQIGSYLCELAKIDYKMKTGQATANAAMESFVIRAVE